MSTSNYTCHLGVFEPENELVLWKEMRVTVNVVDGKMRKDLSVRRVSIRVATAWPKSADMQWLSDPPFAQR